MIFALVWDIKEQFLLGSGLAHKVSQTSLTPESKVNVTDGCGG